MKPLFTLLTTLLISWQAIAQAPPLAEGYTLAQCVAYARKNHPSIRIAQVNEQIADVQTKQVLARNLPQIGVSGSLLDNFKLPVSLLPGDFLGQPGTFIPVQFGVPWNASLSGRVDQKLYDPSLGLALQASKLGTKLRAEATAQAEQTQAYNIAQAYYQALTIDLQRRLLRQNISSTDTLLQQEKVRLDNGTTRDIDFGRIQLNRNNLQSQLDQANRSYDLAINRLKFQMGMPQTEGLTLQPLNVEEETNIADLPLVEEGFYKNRPDFRQLTLNQELQELNRRSNNRGYLPSFGLYGTYGTNAQRKKFNFFDGSQPWFQSGTVGLTMNWTIFDGNGRALRDRESRLNLETLRLQQILLSETAQFGVANAQTSYQNLVADIRRERANMALAQRILTVTELEYKEGIATSVTLIDAKDALTTSQNNLANRLISLYQARLDYENAQGRILDYVSPQ